MKSITLRLGILFLILYLNQTGFGQGMNMPNMKWTDLTYPFSAKTLYWPNNPKGFTMDTLFHGETDRGYFYSAYSFFAPEHGGTHLDAPIHFAEGKKTVDQLSLDALTGEGIVVDVSAKALANRDYQISVNDLLDWEKANGPMPQDAIVLFRTGYGKFYPDPKTYFGTALKGDQAIPELHFPGVDQELALFLTTSRKAKAVGIDTPSIDYGQSTSFHAHRILLKDNIPIFENVAHLDKLPPKGIYIVALPMLLENGSGAPLRIMAGTQE